MSDLKMKLNNTNNLKLQMKTTDNITMKFSDYQGSLEEHDPIYSKSPASTITFEDIYSWNHKSDFSGNYNDLSNKPVLSIYATKSSVNELLSTKVDKVEGMGLSQNSFTTEEKNKLASLENYDDTEIVAELATKASISDIPTKVSELDNDSGFITKDVDDLTYYPTNDAVNAAIGGKQNVIDAAHKLDADLVDDTNSTNKFVTSSDITTWNGKQDELVSGTNIKTINNTSLLGSGNITISGGTTMTLLSYGHSTWNDFINAYNNNSIVYARASSNSDPGSGSQTRLAFMAYVNNATTPTNVEFQYYRSISSHSATQQGDQVFIYKLTNANGGTWSVETREASVNIDVSTGLSRSYSNNKLTLSLTNQVPTKTSDLTNDSGFITNTVNDLTNYPLSSSLSTVATSGSYTDLSNKPTIPTLDSSVSTTSTNGVENSAITTYVNNLLKWKLVASVTGNTPVSLPSTWNEIMIVSNYNDVWKGFTLVIPYGAPNNMVYRLSYYGGASDFINIGYSYGTNNDIVLNFYNINESSGTLSNVTTSVYYR